MYKGCRSPAQLLTNCQEPNDGTRLEQLESLLQLRDSKQEHLPHLLPMLQLDKLSVGGNRVEVASLQLDYTEVCFDEIVSHKTQLTKPR